MVDLSNLSSYNNILLMLCRLRIRVAHDRNKDHLIHIHSADSKHNYHQKKPSKREELLCSLFPPRKQWKKPTALNRQRNGIPRNSSEKNMVSLQVTIAYFKKYNSTHPSLINLDNFIKDIQDSIHLNNYKIGVPRIIPKLKEDKVSLIKTNICRPIASYGLKDKIILSIINKYLTNIVDCLFCDESFAFRAKREVKGILKSPTHHDPVEKIIDYRKRYEEGSLWVSECDMKKFFDTVNHTIIKRTFKKIFSRIYKMGYPLNDIENAKRILVDYLESYKFNKDVLPLNLEQKHFKNFGIPNGEYGWVGDELVKSKYYKRLKSAKIGIPQGGALSGLIANAVLNDIDEKVLKSNDESLLYVRFCDDMLIIHPEFEKCDNAFNTYLDGLRKIKLIPHLHVEPPFLSSLKFWSEKSKKCYKWNNETGCGSSWIGFVGYEIHYQGHVRVRKSSLVKEMKKQFKIMGELRTILKNPLCRSANRTIYESAVHRLIGMSVGRVSLWDYQSSKNEMCWVSGYKLLNDNKYSRIQVRRLDSSRNRLLWNLKNKVEKMSENPNIPDSKKATRIKQSIYYGKPFSYYYHTITKMQDNEKR